MNFDFLAPKFSVNRVEFDKDIHQDWHLVSFDYTSLSTTLFIDLLTWCSMNTTEAWSWDEQDLGDFEGVGDVSEWYIQFRFKSEVDATLFKLIFMK